MALRRSRRVRVIAAGLLTAGCQDSGKTGPSEGLARLTVTYICENDFELESRNSGAVVVAYQVVGTPEAGELRLSAGAADTPSVTRLTTLASGGLRVSSAGEASATIPNQKTSCPAPLREEPGATGGEWGSPFAWPVVAVHLHQLSNGQVLSWGRIGPPTLWDPVGGGFTGVNSGTMVFCSGHSFLADGRLLVAGGHLNDERGLPDANIFDPASDTWTSLQPMHWGRWYPTNTTLPSGDVITLAGKDENGADVAVPELWQGNTWRPLSGAARVLPYYPRTFVAPNGLIFYAGELPQTAYLDPSGSGSWIPVATSNYGRRDYGSAVMYRPGKVMIVGGSDPPDGAPTNTAEVIDLNQASPAWRYTDPMNFARRHLNATLLPDGTVLVTGGTSAAGFSNPAGAVHPAEQWDPDRGSWKVMASNRVGRVYHSTTILLADGRLLHAGSGDGPGLARELSAELFSPPYLFRGLRPELLSSPDRIGYGQEFMLPTDQAGEVIRVTLLGLSSTTHAFDQSQRFVELALRRVAGGIMAAGPPSPAMAPPGPYLVFILNRHGVPSLGRFVRVG